MKTSSAFGIRAALIAYGLLGLACGLSAADTNAPVKGAFRSAADYNTPDSVSGGIQEAIDSLPAGGGTVTVPEGLYLLHRPIVLKDNVKLAGSGKGTILKKNPAFKLMLTENATNTQNFVVVDDTGKLRKGMAIAIANEGQGADIWGSLFVIDRLEGKKVFIRHILGGGGLRQEMTVAKKACVMNLFMNILPGKNCVITDLEIDGSAGEQMLDEAGKYFAYGMLLGGVYPLKDATKVERCWIHDSGYDGIQVNGADTYCTILDCHIYNNRGNGIHVGGGPKTLISQCNIYGNTNGSGVYFCFGNRSLIITDNFIHHNHTGIGGVNAGDLTREMTADRYTIIANNIIDHNLYSGISSRFGPNEIGPQDFVITGNVIRNNQQKRVKNMSTDAPAGISLFNAQRCLVTNNRILDDQDAYPRLLAADAKAGDTQLIMVGWPSGDGIGSLTLPEGSVFMIADKNNREIQTVSKLKQLGHLGKMEITLKDKLANSYTVADGARAVGLKSQMWGIALLWWGSKEAGYDRPDICAKNLVANNLVEGNAIGGVLWAGVDNQVVNNLGRTLQVDTAKPFETSLYPAQAIVAIPNGDFEKSKGWELGKAGQYQDTEAHSGKRCLKITKAEEKGVADVTSDFIPLKACTRYRLSAWVKSKALRANQPVLPHVFLISKDWKTIGAFATPPFEPSRPYDFVVKTGEWVYVMSDFVIGPQLVEARIFCRLPDVAGEGWFDDIAIDEIGAVFVPYSTPAALKELPIKPAAATVKLDGQLNEPAWAGAAKTGGFCLPDGKPAQPDTTVSACYDHNYLYLGFNCADPQPAAIIKKAQGEAEVWQDDVVAILIQPSLNNSDHFQFAATAGGVRFDQLYANGKGNSLLFNPTWQVAVQIQAEGWTAELAIPLSLLAPGGAPAGNSWRINFCRHQRDSGNSAWSPSANWHTVDEYGLLTLAEAGKS